MREIRFRAWNAKDNEMLYFSLDTMINGYGDDFPYSPNKEYEVSTSMPKMQFTGLRDKNGKEIYDGDVVAYSKNTVGKIVYRDDAFIIEWAKNPAGYNDYLRIHVKNGATVIGNIYENPELLK